MKQLAARIFIAFFAALLLSSLGAIALTAWVITERQSTAESELLEAAETAATALAAGGRESLRSWAESRAKEKRASMDILVVDESGTDILGRRLPEETTAPQNAATEEWDYDIPAVLLNLPQTSPELLSTEGESFRLLAVPRRTGLATWRDVPLQLLILALAVTGLTSLLLARSITRPVLALQRTTELLAAGELDTRVSKEALDRRDEIGRLAKSLNTMAERIDSLIRGQQQLLRDVSHEVRSPLARIRLATGLLTQRDPTAVAAVARIDDEVQRLDELIDKILDVSRLESGALSWKFEPLELHQLVDRLVTDAVFEASQLGKSLETNLGDSPMHIVGDRHWVLATIENVVRNALKHTPIGSRVLVELDSTTGDGVSPGYAELRVTDTGHGLAEEELQRIFEPFYRGQTQQTGDGRSDRAASSRADTEHVQVHAAGYGLGLAIAARVMQGHGGHITARNTRDANGQVQGLMISLKWPLASQQVPANQIADEP